MKQPAYSVERILITNDDGYGAPGLEILKQAAQSLAREVWVVAPASDQSGVSHSISLHNPLRVKQKSLHDYAVTGTPADCVVMGVKHLMKGHRPDLILSGINSGANLGVETLFSGTVGGAMTGMLLDIPSIALSQCYGEPSSLPWDVARQHIVPTIQRLLSYHASHHVCFNVNFPDCDAGGVKGLRWTTQGKGLLNGAAVQAEIDPRNNDYYWVRLLHADNKTEADSDINSETYNLARHYITVSPLQFERTDHAVLRELETLSRA
ncbi:5'/3'-nucleotidase SurE [Acetobacteraceae bacterium ESL0709]|nr:5'/3'-nucleotidase SurE [Acetobacteraceae bacterium ESL0697]MDF7677992.1 5'/3'-nucleotidase SurE [Acetobacteraceae bacterium ESL0709]